MINTVSLILILVLSAYFILIFSFYAGWMRTVLAKISADNMETRVSILVPCRNEESQVDGLADALSRQEYPKELIEVIWINDHSRDQTGERLQAIAESNTKHKVITLDGQEQGKKAALRAGAEICTGEFILLTDADSHPGPNWIRSLVSCFRESGANLVAGPVMLGPVNTCTGQVQQLEFLSLVASSIGAAGLGRPIMIQGPNIGIRASDYQQLVHDLDERFQSGDDVFLLQALKRMPGSRIRYALNREAIVESNPARNFREFIRQRQRWASKAKGYTDPFLVLTTLLIFFSNLAILLSLITALAGWSPWFLPLLLLGIKSAADLPLLARASRFFNCPKILAWFIPVQIGYPLYVLFTGCWALLGKVRWRL